VKKAAVIVVVGLTFAPVFCLAVVAAAYQAQQQQLGGFGANLTAAGVPPMFADAYNRAATMVRALVPGCQIRAAAIAAVGYVETRHGHYDNGQPAPIAADGTLQAPYITSSAGATGPMQFMPETWAAYAQDGNGDGTRDIQNIYDAALGTAYMLCKEVPGSPLTSDADLSKAFFAYNHSTAYVEQVLAQTHYYDSFGLGPISAAGAPTAAAASAVQAALTQQGKPYCWGGSGPRCFDCSGLTMWAYAQAGINLPRTSQAQFTASPQVDRSALAPGDLVFFAGAGGTTSSPGHVGIYLGSGQMLDAPHTGSVVRIEPVWTTGYAGATRPSAGPGH
jgi:cell wall-associated NlpC family hydrolase